MEEKPTKELSTQDKAINLLQIFIESKQANQSDLDQNLVIEWNRYKDAVSHVEKDHYACKIYLLHAILDVKLKAGEEESEALFEEINKTATEIVDFYNLGNPDKQQFNNMPKIFYLPHAEIQPRPW